MVAKKEEKTKTKKKTKVVKEDASKEIEEYSLSELLNKYEIKPLNVVGFLDYYGLTDKFKKEFETKEIIIKFTDDEFTNLYERYIKRNI